MILFAKLRIQIPERDIVDSHVGTRMLQEQLNSHLGEIGGIVMTYTVSYNRSDQLSKINTEIISLTTIWMDTDMK
jgi:hypothetical protein